jgi:hypothetical protein
MNEMHFMIWPKANQVFIRSILKELYREISTFFFICLSSSHFILFQCRIQIDDNFFVIIDSILRRAHRSKSFSSVRFLESHIFLHYSNSLNYVAYLQLNLSKVVKSRHSWSNIESHFIPGEFRFSLFTSMSSVTLVHPEETLKVPVLQATNKCSLFQKNPTLSATP